MKLEAYSKEKLLHNPQSLDTFSKNLQIVFEEIEVGRAVATMTLREEMENPIGSIHGGVLFSFADIVGGVATAETGLKVTTLDSNISFMSPAMPGRNKVLTARAQAKKIGKTIIVMGVDIVDESERLICSSTFTFYVLR